MYIYFQVFYLSSMAYVFLNLKSFMVLKLIDQMLINYNFLPKELIQVATTYNIINYPSIN